MSSKNLEVIVIRTMPYKENDLLVDVYSKDYGYLNIHSRGANKQSSKSFYLLKPFNILTIDLLKMDLNNISSYKSGTIIKTFDYLSLDYNQMNFINLIQEIIVKTHSGINNNLEYYEVLYKVINLLNKNNINYINELINIFILETLKQLGANPCLDSCVTCLKITNIVSFDVNDDGFKCKDCLNENHNNISNNNFLRYLYYINKQDYIEASKFKDAQYYTYKLLIKYLTENAGMYLNSLKYINVKEK